MYEDSMRTVYSVLTLWCVLWSLTAEHKTRQPTIHKLDLNHIFFLWKLSALH